MIAFRRMAAALSLLCATAALADPPPATAPAYTPGVSLQAVAIYDAAGNILSSPGAPPDGFVPAGAPFAVAAASVLFTVDTIGYQSIAVQLVGTFSATVTYEASNDGTSWVAQVGFTTANSGTVPSGATDSTAGNTRLFPAIARYFRARISSYTSGTVVAWPILRAAPLSPVGVYVGGGSVALGTGTNTIGALVTTASSAVPGVVPLTATGSALVGKTSSANLYGYSVTMGGTAGYLALLNVTAVPAASATIAPLECVPVLANGYAARRQDIADRYGTGLVAVATSSCTTYSAVAVQVMAVVVQ